MKENRRNKQYSYASFLLTFVVYWTTANTVVSSFQSTPATFVTPAFQYYPGCGFSDVSDCPISRQKRLFASSHKSLVSTRRHFLSYNKEDVTGTSSSTTTADAASIATARTLDLDDEWKFLSSRIKHADVTSDEEYQRRKQEWALRYTSVEALRETFGTNKNKFWGDLQAGTARRLYKTLLPRALLELSKVGALKPQDLAPLAYEARVAAKMYARERSTVPLRLAATLFDGFRQWRTYGKFQGHGLTYEQIWEKYEKAIMNEAKHIASASAESPSCEGDDCSVDEKVSKLILERACKSNDKVDNFALKGSSHESQKELLEQIHAQLQRDVYELLLPTGSAAAAAAAAGTASWIPEAISNPAAIRHFKTLRLVARAKQKILNKKRIKRRAEKENDEQKLKQQQIQLQEVGVSAAPSQPWNDRHSITSEEREQVWVDRPQTWMNRQ